jgi:Tol biopolymer transport system component
MGCGIILTILGLILLFRSRFSTARLMDTDSQALFSSSTPPRAGSAETGTPVNNNTTTFGDELVTPKPYQPATQTLSGALTSPFHTASPSPVYDLPTDTPTPNITPPENWIIYTDRSAGGKNIDLYHPLSQQKYPLLPGTYPVSEPSFSPTGRFITYSAYHGEGWELYRFDLDTQQEQRLTWFNGQPAWSPSGEQIVFEGITGDLHNLWIIKADGSQLSQLTQGGLDTDPAWSPDGSQIVFARALEDTDGNGRKTNADFSDIHVVEVASGKVKRLTSSPEQDEYAFSWSPSHEWIVYCSIRQDITSNGFLNANDSQDLWLVSPSSGEEKRLDVGGRITFQPSWSPDGKLILFGVLHSPDANELWTIQLSDRRLERLAGPGQYADPGWANGFTGFP